MVGSYRDCPVKGLVLIRQVADIRHRETDREGELDSVLPCQRDHLPGEINAVKLKSTAEGNEIRSVPAAKVEKPATSPLPRQRLKLAAEDGVVTEVVPAGRYLVEDFPETISHRKHLCRAESGGFQSV